MRPAVSVTFLFSKSVKNPTLQNLIPGCPEFVLNLWDFFPIPVTTFRPTGNYNVTRLFISL